MFQKNHKDLEKRIFLLLCFGLVALKLLLTSFQAVHLTPYSAPLDDMLMFNAAESIRAGRWLGEYNFLTLSKYMFFAVWVALLNVLHIPYLIGGQLLWAGAAFVSAAAVAPLVQKRWHRLLLFALLLFNPAASAAEVQLRVYRDNIFPALCLLCISGFVGAALRIHAPVRHFAGYVFAGGMGLALAWVTREDGIWLLPFVVVSSGVILVFLAKSPAVQKRVHKAFSLCIPCALTLCAVLSFCVMNNAYYGRFIVSDFTSKEFEDVMGALSRVEHADWQPKVIVPRDVRFQLYDKVPELEQIRPALERGYFYARYGSFEDQEFTTGGFHWALREAAGDSGIYQDANTAKVYFETVAEKVNALCDNGTLAAGPRRSATTAPIKPAYIGPVLLEGARNLWRVVSFEDTYPAFNELSFVSDLELIGFERLLNETPLTVAKAGTNEPYFSLPQRLTNAFLSALCVLYALFTPVLFALALFWLALALWDVLKRKRREEPMVIFVQLGLLLAVILRALMVAFVFVSSFNDSVSRVMYLSSVHPLALLFAFLGTWLLLRRMRGTKNNAALQEGEHA